MAYYHDARLPNAGVAETIPRVVANVRVMGLADRTALWKRSLNATPSCREALTGGLAARIDALTGGTSVARTLYAFSE